MKSGHRYLTEQVLADLKRKMVFVAGPRQVGKTTMARAMLKNPEGYLSWDIRPQRDRILREEWPDVPLLVLDEIHKFRKWRNMLKGLFDQYKGERQILVTGSARLDYYRYGGDSLQGRYHLLPGSYHQNMRLWPPKCLTWSRWFVKTLYAAPA